MSMRKILVLSLSVALIMGTTGTVAYAADVGAKSPTIEQASFELPSAVTYDAPAALAVPVVAFAAPAPLVAPVAFPEWVAVPRPAYLLPERRRWGCTLPSITSNQHTTRYDSSVPIKGRSNRLIKREGFYVAKE